ncbi:MAG: hypothetical protein NUK65_13725, partial [Firmicutes bacterium]|nr:hypothetical protein [Bacillota bacterium]
TVPYTLLQEIEYDNAFLHWYYVQLAKRRVYPVLRFLAVESVITNLNEVPTVFFRDTSVVGNGLDRSGSTKIFLKNYYK